MAMCVWNGRGGAYVPARMSAQRRFHPKMRYCHPQTLHFHPRMMYFHVQTTCFHPTPAPPNDGCALAGRHGRAHRHRPYQTPSCFSVQSAHDQRPHRPCSCNTIHCLEIDESANTFTCPSRRFRGEFERIRTAIHKVDGAGLQGVILRTGPIPIVG